MAFSPPICRRSRSTTVSQRFEPLGRRPPNTRDSHAGGPPNQSRAPASGTWTCLAQPFLLPGVSGIAMPFHQPLILLAVSIQNTIATPQAGMGSENSMVDAYRITVCICL